MEESAKKFSEHIAGDIVLSDNPGNAIKKWRNIFNVSQKELAEKIGITPSVISDYESDRRKSPGTGFIKKVVNGLIEIDKQRGWKTLSKYKDILGIKFDAILDIEEYSKSVNSEDVAKVVDGEHILNFGRKANGHTVIDSIKAILSLNSYDFYRLYGLTSERILAFTKVSSGRSPLVAVRVANLKPSVIILHGLDGEVDEIAVKIAEIEKIDLIVSTQPLQNFIINLRKLGNLDFQRV